MTCELRESRQCYSKLFLFSEDSMFLCFRNQHDNVNLYNFLSLRNVSRFHGTWWSTFRLLWDTSDAWRWRKLICFWFACSHCQCAGIFRTKTQQCSSSDREGSIGVCLKDWFVVQETNGEWRFQLIRCLGPSVSPQFFRQEHFWSHSCATIWPIT